MRRQMFNGANEFVTYDLNVKQDLNIFEIHRNVSDIYLILGKSNY